MNLLAIQAAAGQCLSANAAFAGLLILTELAAGATAEQIAAYEEQFETALLTRGIVVIVLLPEADTLDQVKAGQITGKGAGISLTVTVPIAICENPEVNRAAAADPTATPPRDPAGKNVLDLIEAGIAALLPKFSFPARPFTRPEFGDGYWAYYLQPQRQHSIRAAT